jgi:hypothetical protein
LPKIHLILCKIAPNTVKESSLGIGNNTATADEIEKCWRFVYDIYTKHRDAFELRLSSIPTYALPSTTYERTMTPVTPRLSSISTTPSLSHEQRHSTSSPMPSPGTHLSNHLNNSTSSTSAYQIQTFEEFMRQYVMHIGPETNVVSRIAVKSHSPLLAVKHPHHSHEYQNCAQTFDKTLNDIVERI